MIRFESIFSVDTTSQFDLGADECVTVLGAKVNFLIPSVGLLFLIKNGPKPSPRSNIAAAPAAQKKAGGA